MNEWLSRTQLRQRPMLAVYSGLLILITVATGIAVLLWLQAAMSSRAEDRDRLQDALVAGHVGQRGPALEAAGSSEDEEDQHHG